MADSKTARASEIAQSKPLFHPMNVEGVRIYSTALDDASDGFHALTMLIINGGTGDNLRVLLLALDAIRAYQQDLFNSLDCEISELEEAARVAALAGSAQ